MVAPGLINNEFVGELGTSHCSRAMGWETSSQRVEECRRGAVREGRM